ncbi:hypothetical protein KFU94_09940 [Chloroflexi bacterium TSY]|nr:hypothetical protein [Chloroflexi bacterium TSY]
MWLVKQSDEAAYYIDNNLPHIVELMLAIGRLMFTNDGKPTEGVLEPLEAGRYRWLVAGHEVILKLETDRTLIEFIHLQDDDDLSQLFQP